MESKIDWSKAPESAMVLLKHTRGGAYAVAESFSDDARTWYWPDPRYSFHLMPAMWRVVAERPTTPSWSGEGLPPVGVVCEYCCVNDKWRQVKVIAHMIEMQKDKPCAVSQLGDTGPLCIGGASSFRPIRTTEQIAADEREAAIKEMTANYAKNSDTLAGWAAYVYDTLGYRKEQK